MLGYTEVVIPERTREYWYSFRPQETLQELMELSNIVRAQLEDGIGLAEGIRLEVHKSTRDASADPIGALMRYKGLELPDGRKIDVAMIDSDIHVMTRLAARKDVTESDRSTQLHIFSDTRDRVLEYVHPERDQTRR